MKELVISVYNDQEQRPASLEEVFTHVQIASAGYPWLARILCDEGFSLTVEELPSR